MVLEDGVYRNKFQPWLEFQMDPRKLFFGWLGCAEELCFDECLLSNSKVWSQHPTGVCMTLIMGLSFGNGNFEFLVEFI